MDNLFGKDDSGNDSDAIDIESKLGKRNDCNIEEDTIDIDEHDVKSNVDPLNVHENESPIKLSDPPLNTSESIDIKTEIGVDISKDDDLFNNEIVSQSSRPISIKDRRESKEKNKRELEEEEREKMQVLVSNFTEDQLDRYEMFRRAAFPKAAIKRIMQTITGCSVSQNVVIAMSGIAKVFVGEIVEEALDVMEEYNDTGPLQPKHLREAVRRLRLQGQIPIGRTRKTFFRL
ncbi:hypothetical protein PV325_006791 [Microctonus aethiopoides]|uniref:TAFII28-like protein domain-containing protein n=1 Tax=Microctonus aethiopoides TaxID=144406 RepID=A0AA39C503_9HYME|nr:hypothetical protein PV325_006791 [Microctonus aethiopoides]KAK0097597.1 hypothetical protein PV326_000827 [Microctonus aethiopoides]KAK0158004.1 hypothetical protein PV328_011672 [Microctonus aethiopoides]